MKKSFLDCDNHEIEEFLKQSGEPSYRADQIFKAVYAQKQTSFNSISTLSKNLRKTLDKSYQIRTFTKVDEVKSDIDGTQKFLWQLSDGYKIESVAIYENERTTYCISSQVGCAVDCKFCATGKMGILRNLSAGEIVEQVLQMEEETAKPPTNIVYMGMGEPMLNYKAVIESANTLTNPDGMAMGKRRITISTSGIIPAIKKFTEENQPYTLAISLNSTDDAIRENIMPIARKYPIDQLMKAALDYTSASGKLITFEYVLIDKYNSSVEDAKKLLQLTDRIPCKINIIPCNSKDPNFLPPSAGKIKEFEKIVDSKRRITLRKRKGWEIDAACGQLYAKNEKHGRHKSAIKL